ncbi:MAG: hypothetical protein QM756_43115 [Polyangiaceae bacterium]
MLPLDKQGKRHFGVVFPWDSWSSEMARLAQVGCHFLDEPSLQAAGTPDEHAKAYLADPSGNVIELKAYRDVQRTLRLTE